MVWRVQNISFGFVLKSVGGTSKLVFWSRLGSGKIDVPRKKKNKILKTTKYQPVIRKTQKAWK